MKNPAESKSTDDLPSFFDTPTTTDTATDAGASEHEADPLDADEETGDDGVDYEATVDDEPDHPGADRARARATSAPAGSGALLLTLGLAVLAAATLLGTTLLGSNAAVALARLGLDSGTLFVLGTVLTTGALLQRHQGRAQRAEAGGTAAHEPEWVRSAQESLQFLVASQQAHNERPPAAGEELQHVLIALQRQDEKINNLTKAIKMYGKPLMEISEQTTELAGAATQTRAAIETSAGTVRESLARLGQQIEQKLEQALADGGAQQERAELRDALHVVAADVDKLTKRQVTVSLEPLQQHLGRVEVAVAALAQRLDHSDLQKSLLRLEDAAQKTRDEVHQLRGDGIGKATTQLQDRLDKATKGLADGLAQLRDGNLGGLESSVRDLQRELSGVATAVAQIQAVVKSGARVAAPATTPQPAPTAAAATPAAAPAQPTPPAPPAAGDKGDADNAAYKTGARSSSGKNVLGAIAKLKQMKS